MRATPLASLLLGVLALATLLRPVRSDEAPGAPAEGLAVKAETADGKAVAARYLGRTLKMRAAFGDVDLDLGKVEHVGFDPDEKGGVAVTALLRDETSIYGTLAAGELPVRAADGASLGEPGKGLRGLDIEHPKDLSLGAALVALVTLTFMEIVLGVDNIVFLTIVASRLPEEQRKKARQIGLIAAAGTRILLLFTLSWILGLTKPVFTLPDLPMFHSLEARGISWRDMILLGGGLYLIYSGVREIHEKVEHAAGGPKATPTGSANFSSVIVKIAVIDIVFSLDSVITAVGMADHLWVMVVAMLTAVGVMWFAADGIGRFVESRPTIRVLALSFLILIGVLLLAEGLGQHLNKGYIYFAMAFGLGVELVNLRLRGPARELPEATAE